MSPDQKKVAIGASSGIVTMLLATWGLSQVMPCLPDGADAGARLAFAAKWIALAAAPLFFAIVAVGNARFGSQAIDPTLGRESREMVINGRVVDNSVQQYLLFVAAALAVAASATGPELSLVSGAAVVFLTMRLLFWIGYRIHPLYRAFGMSSTAYLNVLLFGTAVWMSWR
jgi:uncharacterized MAPEG superfamily protein